MTDTNQYIIELNGERIGYTLFEFADPPMGVVFGKIIFDQIKSGYDYFKSYSEQNSIVVDFEDSSLRLITISSIEGLKIINQNGEEIRGIGNSIDGMNEEGFVVTIIGFAYPDFELEFPNHVKVYSELGGN